MLFQYESLHACQLLAPLVETKTKKKTLLRLSSASFSPHHYSQQQRSPFRLFIARQKVSHAPQSLKSKKSLQESTNQASKCYSPHRIYNSLLHMRTIHELKMKSLLIHSPLLPILQKQQTDLNFLPMKCSVMPSEMEVHA